MGEGRSIAMRGVTMLAVSTVLGVSIAATPVPVSSSPAGAALHATQPVDFVVPLGYARRPPVSATTGATIPMWTDSVTASQNGKRYRYQMVGQNPRIRLSDPTTTIVANIIPIVVTFADGATFDPTSTSCAEQTTPLNAVLASPIFNNTVFSPGGTTVGDTQYLDAFQRANFWTYTNPTGINPAYHILLRPKVGKTITIKVPAADGRVISRHFCAAAEVTMAYAVAQGLKLIPTLVAKPWGVNPTTFPIFLLHNVEFDTTLGVAGAVGFHAAIPNPAFHGATQTVAVASYLDATIAPHEADIAVLSHEIGEWINDPLGTNATPPWGNVGQVNGHCQANLEVGDPLTGTTFPVTRDGVTYHPQELAFFSWFYGPIASTGVNGSFSFDGTFIRPAPLCPPGGQ
ncbi:MAG: hypothetical protein ACLPVY_21965 [Acidimicrobiia bacterium]